LQSDLQLIAFSSMTGETERAAACTNLPFSSALVADGFESLLKAIIRVSSDYAVTDHFCNCKLCRASRSHNLTETLGATQLVSRATHLMMET
jgi:hypothetical protein